MRQKQSPMPNNVFYPPPQVPYFQPYQPRPREEPYRNTSYSAQSKSNRPIKPKNRFRRLLRKYFYAAAFPIFLKSEAKKLAQRRKQYLRTFYL